MPDGHNKIFGAQVIYSNVTRKHSGTYVCEGSNGSGFIAKDTIKIDVIRKFFFNLFRLVRRERKCNEMHLYYEIMAAQQRSQGGASLKACISFYCGRVI